MWPPTEEARDWHDRMTAQTLHENGVDVGVHIAKGVGHGIDQTGLSHCARFLLDAFKLPVPKQ